MNAFETAVEYFWNPANAPSLKMRLALSIASILVVAACSGVPRQRQANSSGEVTPQIPAKGIYKAPAHNSRLLSNSEILDDLDEATRSEVRFLLESQICYYFGPYGMNPPPRAGTAYARVICTGNEELLMKLARAKRPVAAAYGVMALSFFAPHRLKELLPQLVTRVEWYKGLRDDLGQNCRLSEMAFKAIRQLDYPNEKDLIARTIEAWFARIDANGAGYEDLGIASELVKKFGIQVLLGLPFAEKETASRLEVFQLKWGNDAFSDAYWLEVRQRFPVGTPQWRTVVQFAVGAGRWETSEEDSKFVASLVETRECDGEDNRAVAARIELECLCELLNPAHVPRYPLLPRKAIARTIRELLTPEVYDGIAASDGPARPLLDELTRHIRALLREPAMPPATAAEVVDLIQARTDRLVELVDDELDDWLVRWPEAYDMYLDRARHDIDDSWIYLSRSDKLLPRWWLVTLERGTARAKEVLLRELYLAHDNEEDAARDADYVSRLRSRIGEMSSATDVRLKWTARMTLLEADHPSRWESDEKEDLPRSRRIMQWLPELIADYADPRLPCQTAGALCEILRRQAWDNIFKYSGDDNSADQNDINAFEDDPFWSLAQWLFLADTKFNEADNIYSGFDPLSELCKLEKTPEQCWSEYQARTASLKGLTPGESPNHPKPDREKK